MFLAGESLDVARAEPTPADVERQEQENAYWWSGLDWWIRCDRCGTVHRYHWDPATEVGWMPYTDERGRKATGADPIQEVCRSSCAARDEQLALC